jgi:hypothetical protein
VARKIAVQLDLDADKYIREARSVSLTTKAADEEMKGLGRAADAAGRDMNELAAGAGLAKKEVDGLGDKADGTGRGLRGLGVDAGIAEHQIHDLGDKSRTTAADLAALDARIKAARLSVRELGLEFARTDDASLSKALSSERSGLGQLVKLRKELASGNDSSGSLLGGLAGSAASAASAGSKVGESFMGGFGAAVSAAGPYVQTALIAGVVAVIAEYTPLIAAAVGGAVVGAVGLGGIAGGIFSASRDPKVKVAARYFGETISTEFFSGGNNFVQPVIDSLSILRRDFLSLKLGDAFGLLAPDVTIIAHGIGDLVKNLMPGLNVAFARFGPYAGVIGKGLGDMGTALGSFLDDASRSKGTLQALDTVFMALNGTITFLGNAINTLGGVYHTFLQSQEALFISLAAGAAALGQADLAQKLLSVARAFSDAGTSAAQAAPGVQENAAVLGNWAEAVGKAIQAGEDWIAMWDKMNGKQMTLDEALLAAHRAVDAVKDAFEDGTKSIMGHSEAVVENRVMLEKAAAAAVVVADAYRKAGGSQEGAQKIMDEFRIAAEKATGATGAQAREVHGLADELFKLPAEVNTTVTTTYIEKGSHPTYNPGSSSFASEEVGHRATGGPVLAGKSYWVNEDTPNSEIFTPAVDGYITPAGTQRSASDWQSGAGTTMNSTGSQAPVNLTVQLVDSISGKVVRQILVTDALNRNRSAAEVQAAYP